MPIVSCMSVNTNTPMYLRAPSPSPEMANPRRKVLMTMHKRQRMPTPNARTRRHRHLDVITNTPKNRTTPSPSYGQGAHGTSLYSALDTQSSRPATREWEYVYCNVMKSKTQAVSCSGNYCGSEKQTIYPDIVTAGEPSCHLILQYCRWLGRVITASNNPRR